MKKKSFYLTITAFILFYTLSSYLKSDYNFIERNDNGDDLINVIDQSTRTLDGVIVDEVGSPIEEYL